MRKSFLFGFLLGVSFLMFLSAGRAEDRAISILQPFGSTALPVNSTNYSAAVDLADYHPYSFVYSLQVLVTNAIATNLCGKLALSYELSNDNAHWPTNGVIVSEISFTNSPVAGGQGFYAFEAAKSRYLRLKAIVTETNCWLSGWLAVQ